MKLKIKPTPSLETLSPNRSRVDKRQLNSIGSTTSRSLPPTAKDWMIPSERTAEGGWMNTEQKRQNGHVYHPITPDSAAPTNKNNAPHEAASTSDSCMQPSNIPDSNQHNLWTEEIKPDSSMAKRYQQSIRRINWTDQPASNRLIASSIGSTSACHNSTIGTSAALNQAQSINQNKLLKSSNGTINRQ